MVKIEDLAKVFEGKFEGNISEQTELNSLVTDSIEFLEMVLDLEDKFKISIEDSDVENLKTVGDVLNFLNK